MFDKIVLTIFLYRSQRDKSKGLLIKVSFGWPCTYVYTYCIKLSIPSIDYCNRIEEDNGGYSADRLKKDSDHCTTGVKAKQSKHTITCMCIYI